jgi:hypothetical protein
MPTIVNLNKARKKKARATAAQQAAENRLRFGRTPAEKAADAAAVAESRRRLDLLRREPQDD